MVRIYMFTVCLVLLLGMSTCVPVWAATPSASYDYDAATHYDHSLDSDCQSTPPGCSYVALEHKTDCVHSESRTNNTGLFGILCWSSIIVVGYLSVSRDYDTPSNKFNNSPHRPNYDVRIEPRCTSTTTLKNEMSQYRAYFVPGKMDPSGKVCQQQPFNFGACEDDALRAYWACWTRGTVICSIVCGDLVVPSGRKPLGGGKRKPPKPKPGKLVPWNVKAACLLCLSGYGPACDRNLKCNMKYCNDQDNNIPHSYWKRAACGGSLGPLGK